MKLFRTKSTARILNWTSSIATPFASGLNPTPALTVSHLQLPGVRIMQVSARGLRHATNRQLLQDFGAISSSVNGRYAIQVLCDGISSEQFADEGAYHFSRLIANELAVALEQVTIDEIQWDVFGQLLSHRFRLDHLPHAITSQFSYPADFAAANGMAIPGESLFGTTAEILIVDTLKRRFHRVRLSGDGGLFISSLNARFEELILPTHSDLAENQVDRLPNWKVRPVKHEGDLPANWTLLFTTDGFADALRASRALEKLVAKVSTERGSPLSLVEKIACEAAQHTTDDLGFGITWPSTD